MLFNDNGLIQPRRVLAISQPAHALISGQILASWAKPLSLHTVLAAEQHDIAWLDWEVSPTFDPATGRPHFFRAIGAALHAPMWERGVDRALAAWGRHVALLVSRHGSTIYERFSDRHRSSDAVAKTDDDRAAQDYLRRHRSLQAGWMQAIGLDAGELARQADLLAFADTLSLGLCGALPMPDRIEVDGRTLAVTRGPDAVDTYIVDPWPFKKDEINFELEARAMPSAGRFADDHAMRNWLAEPNRVTARSVLRRHV